MSIRVLLRSGLLALPLVLAACAGSPLKKGNPGAAEAASLNHARQALAEAELCCTQFSQFDFSKPLPDSLERFKIGPGQPVADFDSSRSWFLAFHLPDDSEPPVKVLFKSTLTGRWLHHSYLFAPSVVVLDAAYRPLRVKDIELCEYMGWTQSTSGAFGHLVIDDPAARYLVVYTSGEQLSSSTYWEQSPTAFSTQSPVEMTSSGDYQISHGPNGTVYVGKLTDEYRKTVENSICNKTEDKGEGVLKTLRDVFLPGSSDSDKQPPSA